MSFLTSKIKKSDSLAIIKRTTIFMSALLVIFVSTATGAFAGPPHYKNIQQNSEEVIYVVQPGDTLILIALRYNLNIGRLLLANNLFNPYFVFPGQQLILPGVQPPTPTPMPASTITSTPGPTATPTPIIAISHTDTPHTVQPGESLYTISIQYSVPVGSLVLANNLPDPDVIQAGQTLLIPAGPIPTPGVPTAPFETVELSEPTIIQGRTLVVKITLSEEAALNGSFEGQPLIFTGNGAGQRWAITAIHPLLEPNTYPIILTAALPNGETITRVETVKVVSGPYGWENIQLDSSRSGLLDADLLAQERKKLFNLWSQVSPKPQWAGPFRYPVDANDARITSYFGTRRTYNNSQELSFHSGTDFSGTGTPVFAPAAGTVVLAEPLTVRGNAVVINHGLGVYSGYWHQSQLAVTEGQTVQPGDLIGYIGNTGLVTGPHLHWELRLNGIAVNPLQWVRESIP